MTIKKFLILTSFILFILVLFLTYKHLEREKHTASYTAIQNYDILKTSCSSSLRGSSSVYILYNGKEYKVPIGNASCQDIENKKFNGSFYYIIEKDIIYIGEMKFYFAFMVITYVFLFFTIFGFYIYRNELDNSYKTM